MNDTYIKLWRSVRDMDIYSEEPFTRFQCWLDLLLEATPARRTFTIRGNKVTIERGELAVSIKELSERWKLSDKTTRSRIIELEERGLISVKRSKIVNVINIVDYEETQQIEQKGDALTEKNNNYTQQNATNRIPNRISTENQEVIGGDDSVKMRFVTQQKWANRNSTENQEVTRGKTQTTTQQITQQNVEPKRNNIYTDDDDPFAYAHTYTRVGTDTQPNSESDLEKQVQVYFQDSAPSILQSTEQRKELSQKVDAIFEKAQEFENLCLQEAKQATEWLQVLCMRQKISIEEAKNYLDEFHTDNYIRQQRHNTTAHYRKHFADWLRCHLDRKTRSASLKTAFNQKPAIQRSATAIDTSQMDYGAW